MNGDRERRSREDIAHKPLKVAAAALLFVCVCVLIAANIKPSHNHQGMALDSGARMLRARAAQPKPADAPRASGAVRLNHATADELEAVKGIGPALAARIIEERETNGRFAYPEDLLTVKGIGRKTLQKLLEQITLD